MDECTLWSRIVHQLRASCRNFDQLWIKRIRVFDTETVIKGLLNLVGHSQSSYHQALDQLVAQNVSPAASSFCEARAKLPSFVVGEVRRDVMKSWDEASQQQRWRGFRLYAIDGTKVSLPRPLFQHGLGHHLKVTARKDS